jgi:hypothetical protein
MQRNRYISQNGNELVFTEDEAAVYSKLMPLTLIELGTFEPIQEVQSSNPKIKKINVSQTEVSEAQIISIEPKA